MKKEIKKYSMLYNFFKDYYIFIQDYAIPEDDDEFWEGLMDAANILTKKYGQIEEYCKDLVWAHIRDLERKYKEMGQQQKLNVWVS